MKMYETFYRIVSTDNGIARFVDANTRQNLVHLEPNTSVKSTQLA